MGVIVWYVLISFLIIRNNKQERIAGGAVTYTQDLKEEREKVATPPP